MQGTIDASALQIGDASQGLEVDYTEENAEASSNNRGRGSINLDKYTSLNVSGKIPIGDGQNASVKVKMKNVKVDYAISLKGETFVKLRGDSDLSCSVKIDGVEAIGMNEITLIPAQIPGVGGFDMIMELSAGGDFSCKTTGDLTTGISYSKANGFRIIKGFKAKSFSFSCKASASVGLKVRMGITGKLLPIKGYVYTKAGGKAVLEQVTYDKGTPETCSTFAAYVYASTGAKASIKLGMIQGSIDDILAPA